MGAGCHYTHENGSIAYWIDPEFYHSDQSVNAEEDDFDFLWNGIYSNISDIMKKIGYEKNSKNEFQNGLAIINFEPTYYGDGLVIKIKERYEDQSTINLFNANFDRMEKKIAKALNKHYPLAYATSGYTANRIKIGELK